MNHLPTLTICHHAWLYVMTYALPFTEGLLVYRSPMVRQTDPIFQPVADLLRDHRMTMVYQERLPDPGMMFGQGEVTAYRLSHSEVPLQWQVKDKLKGLLDGRPSFSFAT